ncbi:MAG: hypothetical protein AB8C95_01145, partial [Phycisphaeraceae bacterium]
MHDEQAPLDEKAIEAYLLGSLSDDEVASLDRVLRDDPAALQQLADVMQIMSLVRQDFAERESYRATHKHEPLLEDFDALMKDLSAREAAASAETVRISEDPIAADKKELVESISPHELGVVAGYLFRKTVSSKPFIIGNSALAAAIVLLASLFFFVDWADDVAPQVAEQADDQPTPIAPENKITAANQVVATITATHNAKWSPTSMERASARGSALTTGSKLHANDRLTLTAGTAEITTLSGAVVLLQGPARIELTESNNALYLHAGKLVGICETESSKGLLVRTPHLDITDLGTRFGVDVVLGTSTEVHVHQGEVIAKTKATTAAQSTRQHLTANQAIRSNATNHSIVSITPDFDKFDPSLRTYLLPGTGFGLAEGEADLNWQIVADGNGPLDTPIQVKVQYTDSAHWDAVGNDAGKAQNLIFVNGYPEYDFPQYKGLATPSITLRSTFEVPKVELENAALKLIYATRNGVRSLRINGQAVEPLAKQSNGGIRDNTRHAATRPIEQTGLKHGTNVIEVELANK